MQDKCWFCNENESQEDTVYNVALVMKGNRKDTKIVDIPRCSRCDELHKKADLYSILMYVGELVLISLLLFVFKLEFMYVALVYLILMRVLSDLAQKIRRKVSAPYKSVCDVYQNDAVSDLVEQGYIEKRRF